MSSNKTLRFIAIVVVILAVIGLLMPEEGITLFGVHISYPSPQSIMKEKEQSNVDLLTEVEPVELKAAQDTLRYLYLQRDSGDLRFWLPNPHYLDDFWEAVSIARVQKYTVRILHYGDSQIEMDHISSRLRAYMQSTFGGGGPGMLPVKPITPIVSVRQSTQGPLVHLASFGDSLATRSRGNYGLMMQCFRIEGGESVVSIKVANSSRIDDAVKRFDRVKLIANNRSSLVAEFTNMANKKRSISKSASSKGIVALDWVPDSTIQGFKIRIRGNADLYALLVDADSGGVAVDNIPMRGCSGSQFTLVDNSLLTEAYSQMNVGLIIMQFGGNTVPYIKSNSQISTYCKSIGKQIDYIHQCCPTAKILFIGPSDMSHRVNGEMKTYTMLPTLIDSLVATVTAHHAAYWSIYHAMGGYNSMKSWVKQGLAGKDYIHFSPKGADLMGERLATAFKNSYALSQLEKRIAAEKHQADQLKKNSKKSNKGQRQKSKVSQRKGKKKKGGHR